MPAVCKDGGTNSNETLLEVSIEDCLVNASPFINTVLSLNKVLTICKVKTSDVVFPPHFPCPLRYVPSRFLALS